MILSIQMFHLNVPLIHHVYRTVCYKRLLSLMPDLLMHYLRVFVRYPAGAAVPL